MTDITSPAPSAQERIEDADRTIGIVNYVLLIVAPLTSGLTALAAVILAYVRRNDADSMTRSHYGFQIRIFWIAIALFVAGILCTIAAIGFGVLDAVGTIGGADGLDAWDVAGLEEKDIRINPAPLFGWGSVAALAFAAHFIWTFVASLFGLVKLASQKGIGRTA